MNDDNLIALPAVETTESFDDALTALVRQGARQIIRQAKVSTPKPSLPCMKSI